VTDDALSKSGIAKRQHLEIRGTASEARAAA
jgi:hypothetical protein